jgi:hypothetical protein
MSNSWQALLFLLPLLLGAQTYTASVRGASTDSTKAAVPSALVTVTDVERNVPYSTKADSVGRYVLPTLPPGIYTLTVVAPGFATHTQPSFPLAVQQQATIDVEMSVGGVATTVDVTGNAPTPQHHGRDPGAAGGISLFLACRSCTQPAGPG